MTYIKTNFQDFIRTLTGFEELPTELITKILPKFQAWRFRIGQKIIGKEAIPDHIGIIYEGKVRLLGYDPRTQVPITLKILEPGDFVGEISLLRQVPCETAIASTEVIILSIATADFLSLLATFSNFAQIRQNQVHLAEVFEIVGLQLEQQANAGFNLKELTEAAAENAIIQYIPPGKIYTHQLETEKIWFVSGNGVTNYAPNSPLQFCDGEIIEVKGEHSARLIGFNPGDFSFLSVNNNNLAHQVDNQIIDNSVNGELLTGEDELNLVNIPYAPEKEQPVNISTNKYKKQKYPFVSGKGEINATSACLQMLCQHLKIPFRREVVRRILNEQFRRQETISFQVCAYLSELIGLKPQLIDLPTTNLTRIPTPALIRYGNDFAVVYEASDRMIVLGVPSQGIQYCKPGELIAKLDVGENSFPPQLQILLLSPTKETPQQRFGLSWFLPYLSRHRQVLIEVFIASFFVQLAALANPLVIQLIIDKVIVQNSITTLNILGVLLLAVGLFEAVLGALRTYLFVDTTNRIDMGLGSEIIDHLLRLPLRYFERRPVGELSTRINELENIRQFLTGTALTVGLDALFSVVYIVVMLFYSWQLTLVGLATIPVFILITFIASPVIRKQLRSKAERNAETQSYLVEVMSGIQTVKAQNIELRSRFSWQEKYARYVGEGFKTVITSTFANSASQFLNQLSSLLVLWVGSYLVLKGELTLGELIAFRIISGYVTSPILRLAQLWQSFQETALSLERLSDIVDTPQEAEKDRYNIPLPEVAGAVKYENVSFRFATSGPLQVCNVNLEIPAGKFVGIVGQSGSGKSTIMKLLLRLYEPESGRILIDNYDIAKVELYSLRRQLGVVPQESLLFDGSVQENIALTNPDATTAEIIAAAKIAAAHDFIMDLPNGYNTRVGERGAGLSGGQRQRIAIARSVLQRPQLLVLDEATSALDYPTERQVCINLANAFQGNTVFFITHRLNTVSHADIILVMDGGRLIEQGNHQELMRKKGHYFYLYNQQEVNL
ncbi:peptidase domain-containing ABC transporter [Calothrix sp. UHCC 0171]|uniref:peptidase domain-containing ABC transporter n=1 Tax=Calothrix sp. UHCC 0171 TaxID=3110245 RepID=UPI002B21E04D|nr:peptidase domain-containing ABC transporter [Calothrix sp. UHCC 0171]MEA5572289.1 peptidase domain-containing ABC transporter [Calothrix sp. UHCC 0171]